MLKRVFGPAIVGGIAAGAYFFINMRGLNAELVTVDEYYGEQFYAVIATLYAIITALLLVKGIETFNALSAAVNDEAMKIRSLNAYMTYFYSSGKEVGLEHVEAIRTELLGYVSRVRGRGQADANPENEKVIDRCIRYSAHIDVGDENDRIALAEVMRGLDEFRQLRARRINCAKQKIPPYLIRMLALMTLAIMAPFYLHHEPGIGFNTYILFTLGTFGSFIYFLLNDINTPYDGLWTVEFDAYEVAEAELQAMPKV